MLKIESIELRTKDNKKIVVSSYEEALVALGSPSLFKNEQEALFSVLSKATFVSVTLENGVKMNLNQFYFFGRFETASIEECYEFHRKFPNEEIPSHIADDVMFKIKKESSKLWRNV